MGASDSGVMKIKLGSESDETECWSEVPSSASDKSSPAPEHGGVEQVSIPKNQKKLPLWRHPGSYSVCRDRDLIGGN